MVTLIDSRLPPTERNVRLQVVGGLRASWAALLSWHCCIYACALLRTALGSAKLMPILESEGMDPLFLNAAVSRRRRCCIFSASTIRLRCHSNWRLYAIFAIDAWKLHLFDYEKELGMSVMKYSLFFLQYLIFNIFLEVRGAWYDHLHVRILTPLCSSNSALLLLINFNLHSFS